MTREEGVIRRKQRLSALVTRHVLLEHFPALAEMCTSQAGAH